MTKILMIGMTDNRGGIESFIINYYRKIDRNRFKIDFINIYDKGLFFEDEILKNGDKIYSLPNYYKHPIKYIKELCKIITINKYDISYCNMNSAVMLYPLIASKMGHVNTIVCHSHNSSSDKGVLKRILHFINKHFIKLFANKYVACSDKAGKWFYSQKTRSGKDYYVISNAIDADKFKFNIDVYKEYRDKLKINEDSLVLGHVGRFDKQKNHEYLIDIFNEVHKKNKNSYLLLIGIGELKNEIELKVKKLNLSNNVIFLGLRNDTEKLYQCMDVFVLPSLYEGFPLVCVEAQCSGLKCIFSSNISPETKLLDTTILFPIDVPAEEWANKILEYKKNITNRKNGYINVVKKGYDLNSEILRFQEMLEDWSMNK